MALTSQQVEELSTLKKIVEVLLNGDSFPRLVILNKISQNGEVSREELAKDLNLTPQTVSTHIKVLEREGLIEVERDEDDLRRNRYRATPLAIKVIDVISEAAREVHVNVKKYRNNLRAQLNELSEKERALVRRIRKLEKVGRRKEVERLKRQLDEVRNKRNLLIRNMVKKAYIKGPLPFP